MEIVRPDAAVEERVVVHGPGEFTGEINMLSGRRSLVRGRIAREGDVCWSSIASPARRSCSATPS